MKLKIWVLGANWSAVKESICKNREYKETYPRLALIF